MRWVDCRLIAWACAAAATVDASTPRPGLASIGHPWLRGDVDPVVLSHSPAAAFEACLRACREPGRWLQAYSWAVRFPSRLLGSWEYTGALLLLSLQAAATGYASTTTCPSREHVMGHARLLVESSPGGSAALLYEAWCASSPSHLAELRIGYAGLPEAPCGQLEAAERGVSAAELLEAMSLHDLVARDAWLGLQLSLGEALVLIEEALESGSTLPGAVAHATLGLLAEYTDTLWARRCGYTVAVEASRLARRALSGSASAEAELWRLARRCPGPGSVADIVASATARLLFELTSHAP